MTTANAFAKLAQMLPFGLTVEDVVSMLAAIAVFIAVVAVWQALKIGDPLQKRLRSIKHRQEHLRGKLMEPKRNRTRTPTTGAMHSLVGRMNLLRSKHATDAQVLLARAGFRSEDAMVRYLFFRLVLPTLFGLAVSLDAYWVPIVKIAPNYRAIASIVAIVLGMYAPQIYLKNAADKRRKKIAKSLPDGLDLMVICAGAGLSLDGSLQRVSRELGKTWPELAEEFTLTSVELTFLPERRQALDNLLLRVDLASMRGVVNTLMQTEKFGTPLVHALRVLAAEFRDQRMLKAEEKAARLSVLLTLPLMLFIMPALFVVLLGPAALNVLDMMHHH